MNYLAKIAILGILMALSMASPVRAVPIVLPSHQICPIFIAQRSVAGCCKQGGSGFMRTEEMRSLIEKAAQAWMAGDADAFVSLFLPTGEFIIPGNRWVGQAEIRKAAVDFAATNSDVKIDIGRIIVEGDRAVVEWHWQDREKATGRLSQADDAIVVDFKEGRLARWREYIDTETPARKLQGS